MTGTIINVIAVLLGGGIGLAIKKGIPERIHQAVTYMLGLSTCVIGLNGLLGTMLTVDAATGQLHSSGELLLLGSLAVGALCGELLQIEERLGRVGDLVEARLGASHFSTGFISASVLFCVGAMTIMGAIQDGLGQGYSILLTKSSLDFIASIILAASLGVGVLGSALTVLLYQGGLTLLAGVLQGVLAGALLDQLCMVGYAIVLCIGINFFGVVKIKTASLLPALLVPLLYNVPMLLKTL